MIKQLIGLAICGAILFALHGCTGASQARTHTAARALTAFTTGLTSREPVTRICVCDTDYDCQVRCGGSY